MSKKSLHIVLLLLLALLITGCSAEPVPIESDANMTFTVRCVYPTLTKTEPISGVDDFNENLILSVDFLFYPGAKPNPETEPGKYADYCNQQAVHHVRKELSKGDIGESALSFVIRKDAMRKIFPENGDNKATVYALVNFDSYDIENKTEASLNQWDQARIVTDFAEKENNFIQSKFLMDGESEIEITYDENNAPKVQGVIWVKRFATKLTLAIHVEKEATLEHQNKEDGSTVASEIWTPILNTMRIYMVDGYKSCLIGGGDEGAEADKYFTYRDKMRPFLKDDGTPTVSPDVIEGEGGEEDIIYYNTYPMYSYPGKWSNYKWDYGSSNLDFSTSLPHEQPYIKLEMDWRRKEEHGYSYDRRKYYYKVFLPLSIDEQGNSEFIRNNWYALYLNVSILGSTTDDGMASLTPSVYLLDWQNKTTTINKFAVISKARYLSLEKTVWKISNQSTLNIPFISSHDVVVTGTVEATRPYYGDMTNQTSGSYHDGYHAWIKGNETDGYYLQYHDQPEGNEQFEPSNWIKPQSTSILLDHELQNDFTQPGFDYSPFTIKFKIVHKDLADDPSSYTYSQYTRDITITQFPAIYIEATRNSDTEIIRKSGRVHGYPNPPYPPYREGIDDSTINAPWEYMPWGYVFVNGGRFVRWDYDNPSKKDPYYKLQTDNEKKEYQWQSVYYSGGSKDIFNIHVTVLPSTTDAADFVIGDPRKKEVDNLNNIFIIDYNEDVDMLEHIQEGNQYEWDEEKGKYIRNGFNSAAALYGRSPRRLEYYHPTETNSVLSEKMIAPIYRISSKFGGTEYGSITKQYAEYRCAGYQEDGFPAGRWRLPTRAEVSFIAQLSAKKTFEVLFNFGDTYWSANGPIMISKDGSSVSSSSATTALLRCVYDSWYWDPLDLQEGKTVEGEPRLSPPINSRDHFIWGDKE